MNKKNPLELTFKAKELTFKEDQKHEHIPGPELTFKEQELTFKEQELTLPGPRLIAGKRNNNTKCRCLRLTTCLILPN